MPGYLSCLHRHSPVTVIQNAEKSQDNIPGEEKMKEMDEKPLTYHELSSNRQSVLFIS